MDVCFRDLCLGGTDIFKVENKKVYNQYGYVVGYIKHKYIYDARDNKIGGIPTKDYGYYYWSN